jgi:hypothetical protein
MNKTDFVAARPTAKPRGIGAGVSPLGNSRTDASASD